MDRIDILLVAVAWIIPVLGMIAIYQYMFKPDSKLEMIITFVIILMWPITAPLAIIVNTVLNVLKIIRYTRKQVNK